MLFAQIGPLVDLKAARLGVGRGGVESAPQIAAVDVIEMDAREFAGQRPRLRAALVIKSDVELSLKAPFEIPVRLAVPGETDKRAGHVFVRGGAGGMFRFAAGYRPISRARQAENS